MMFAVIRAGLLDEFTLVSVESSALVTIGSGVAVFR